MESRTKIVKIMFDQEPTPFQEVIVKTIRPRGFIQRQVLDYIINFLAGKRHF